jgi:large subunit ribosomal protein L15
VVNLDTLEEKFEANAEVTPEALLAQGIVKDTQRVKVLGRGEITKALKVSAHSFSDSAKEKITAAGGSISELAWNRPPRKIR